MKPGGHPRHRAAAGHWLLMKSEVKLRAMTWRVVSALSLMLLLAVGFALFGFPWRWLNGGWHLAPAVTIVSQADDARIPVVNEAIAFWNQTFTELGTPFRLGPVQGIVGELPDAELQAMSERTSLRSAWLSEQSAELGAVSTDLGRARRDS